MIKSILIGLVLALLAFTSCKKDNKNNNNAKYQVADFDGNLYDTVHIGTQIWMKENLKTSHYRDGSPITEIEDSLEWTNVYNLGSNIPAWCYYNGNASNNGIYGKLYNWYCATDIRHICPTGWHVPSVAEWLVLINYYGGENLSGGHLKATTLWAAPNAGADNASGFTALPAGIRGPLGRFELIDTYVNFCSTTSTGDSSMSSVLMYNVDSNTIVGNIYKQNGFSVRCIHD
ncbi:MAG: hypothetical protein JWO06_1610 [Bacteroidota bacterium]|nr:hypothetical protein [Bacteroidota bacterium]